MEGTIFVDLGEYFAPATHGSKVWPSYFFNP